ncbi:MAG: hypothetical protein NTU43_02775, partial [Bacteroidetes bacterium]|nr:hypothetical protein [Bacteroidota bacterium]
SLTFAAQFFLRNYFRTRSSIFAVYEIVIANKVKQSLKRDCHTALRFVRNDARLRGTKNILRQIL